MEAAYECGVNFFDCAEAYSKGESEIVMGEAIKKFGWKRNDLVISTKVIHSLRPAALHDERLLNEDCSCTGEVRTVTTQSTTRACPASTSSRA